MMEGISGEAASLAGHLALDNLCWIYDNNHITIEGNTALAFSDDVATRFIGYGWNVTRVGRRQRPRHARARVPTFKKTTDRPTLIIVDSHIAYGAPNKQDTSAAHGEPLGAEEIRLTKRHYGWPEDAKFLVPDGVREHFAAGIGARGARAARRLVGLLRAYNASIPSSPTRATACCGASCPTAGIGTCRCFPPTPRASRRATRPGKVLNAIAQNVPWLIGGSADLGPSCKTRLTFDGAGDFSAATAAAGTCTSASASTPWARSSTACRCRRSGRTARAS